MGYTKIDVADIQPAGPDEIPVRIGTFMRFDPGTTRQPVAGPEGMTIVAVGAPRGSYQARGPF